MDTKNFFAAWQETQTKLMNNWTESARKMQDAVRNGSAAEQGVNIYQEWLKNQSEITQTATEHASKNASELGGLFSQNGAAKNGFDFTAYYNEWMNNQRELMNKTVSQMQDASKNFGFAMPNAQDWFTRMQEMQQTMWNPATNWMNNPMMSNPFNMQQNSMMNNWMNQSQEWMKNFMAPWQQLGEKLNDKTMKEAWENMTNMSQTWMNFYQQWQPMFKHMTENTWTPESFKSIFNPEQFRTMFDSQFNWSSPVHVKELFQQYSNWMETAQGYSRNMMEQMMVKMPESARQLMPFLAYGNGAENNSVFAAYQRAMNPLVRLYAPGKESEMNELFNAMMEKLATYGKKLTELQYHLYTNGAQTWEQFVNEAQEQIKKGVDLSNTQQVFQQWTAKNEEAMIALFRSDAYSKLQGELLDLGLEIRQQQEKMVTVVLSPLPIVMRSEADELHQTIYDLKKRLRALEKQAGATEEVKETKSSKKKTTTV
jgi:hypothetical protein